MFIAVLALALWAVDQASKAWALSNLDPDNPPAFLGGLVYFKLLFNSGAAFSMGESFTVGFTIFSFMALIGAAIFLFPRARGWWQITGLGLLLAGILGNLTDRLCREPGPFRGHVVDFIALPYFAVFNVADMCITGAAIVAIMLAFRSEKDKQHSTKESSDGTVVGS